MRGVVYFFRLIYINMYIQHIVFDPDWVPEMFGTRSKWVPLKLVLNDIMYISKTNISINEARVHRIWRASLAELFKIKLE